MIAKTIRTCFPIAAAAVSDKAEEINKLNVFPVPDGDTGTNMSLTLASVTKELLRPSRRCRHGGHRRRHHSRLPDGCPRQLRRHHLADSSRRGRGSCLRRRAHYVCQHRLRLPSRRQGRLPGCPQAYRGHDPHGPARCLDKADECEKKKFSAEDALDAIVVEAYQSVARMPDLLPVLKENGVVDSGAFGFAIFLENFVAAALGRSTVVEDFSATFDSAGSARDAALGRVEIEANDDWERLGVPLLQRVPL